MKAKISIVIILSIIAGFFYAGIWCKDIPLYDKFMSTGVAALLHFFVSIAFLVVMSFDEKV